MSVSVQYERIVRTYTGSHFLVARSGTAPVATRSLLGTKIIKSSVTTRSQLQRAFPFATFYPLEAKPGEQYFFYSPIRSSAQKFDHKVYKERPGEDEKDASARKIAEWPPPRCALKKKNHSYELNNMSFHVVLLELICMYFYKLSINYITVQWPSSLRSLNWMAIFGYAAKKLIITCPIDSLYEIIPMKFPLFSLYTKNRNQISCFAYAVGTLGVGCLRTPKFWEWR